MSQLEANQNDADPTLTLGQMIKWLVCISSGMKYLSDKKMVHRDLRHCWLSISKITPIPIPKQKRFLIYKL